MSFAQSERLPEFGKEVACHPFCQIESFFLLIPLDFMEEDKSGELVSMRPNLLDMCQQIFQTGSVFLRAGTWDGTVETPSIPALCRRTHCSPENLKKAWAEPS